MALTASEEAQLRSLLDQQAAILSLAGNEATITSKLGATKVNLSDLTAASTLGDTDLFLVRQGGTDKSVAALVVKTGLSGNAVQKSGDTMSGPLVMSGAAINETQGSNIASASTVNLDAATGNYVRSTGTATWNAVTLAQGAERTVVFGGAQILAHGANLILLGGVNITTAVGDVAVFRGEASGVVRCIVYSRASGAPVTASAGFGNGAAISRTGVRAINTTYTNTDPVPRWVSMWGQNSAAGGSTSFVRNGNRITNQTAGDNTFQTHGGWVAPGDTYSITTYGHSITVSEWWEGN